MRELQLKSSAIIIIITFIITTLPSLPALSAPPVINAPLPFWFKTPKTPCVRESPNFEVKARSRLDCSVKCFTDMSFDCLKVNYWRDKTCQMFQSKSTYNEVNVVGCFSYRNYGCPHSFTYIQLPNICFKLDFGLYNWNESKAFCNQNHPEGHPIVMETVARHKIILYYARLINVTAEAIACLKPHPMYAVMKLWTGGSIVRNPTTLVYSYFWEPFNSPIPFGEGTLLWGPTYPDHYLHQEFCIGTVTNVLLNDDRCRTKMCTMCEVDLVRVLI